jgi:hypothetical protein
MNQEDVKRVNPLDDDDRTPFIYEVPFKELSIEDQCEVLAAIKLGNYRKVNVETLCKEFGMNYRTIYRRLKHPAYIKAQKELKREYIDDVLSKCLRDLGQEIFDPIPNKNLDGTPIDPKTLNKIRSDTRQLKLDILKMYEQKDSTDTASKNFSEVLKALRGNPDDAPAAD